MPEILFTEATIISSLLDSFCQQTTTRVKHLSKFITNVSDILETTSRSLFHQHRGAQKQLDNDLEENPSVHQIEVIAFASIFDLAKRLKQAGEDIKKLLEKVTSTSIKSLYGRLDDVKENCSELITSVKHNNDKLKDIEKKIEQSLKSSPSQTLLRSKSGGLLKFDDIRHRTQVLITNKIWLEIQSQYKRIIDEANVLNKSRCEFSRLLFINFISILGQKISTYNCENLLKQMDEFNYSNKLLVDFITTSVENKCGRSQFLRNRMVASIDLKTQNDDQIIRNFKDIEAFSQLFIMKSKMSKRQYQHARNMIMSEAKWGEYFLSCLCSKLYTQIVLDKDMYDELATVIKIMFANLSEQKGRSHMIYKILYIALRVSHDGSHLVVELSKYKDHWENEKRWEELINFLKKQLDNQNKQKALQSQQKSLIREKSLNFLLKNSNLYIKASCVDEVEDTAYEALREINIMIAKLQLNDEFIINFLVKMCGKHKISDLQKKKLITYHHKHKKSAIELYLSKKEANNRRLVTYNRCLKSKLISCIKKSLEYVPIGPEFTELMVVSRGWHKQLRESIFKRVLIDEPNINIIAEVRPKIYAAYIPSAYSKQIYAKMKSQLPAKAQIFHLIKMDVHRSLNWQPRLKPKLQQILRLFSFYNDKVGYLQGMNYLGEHLLKLNLGEQGIYTIFEYIIIKYFSDMFSCNFDLMRLKFYQFNRLMEVYHPKLFKHFENEKIEAEHYLVAWIMTLWGELQGDIVWILWDGFLVDGWKWWMQTGLWILEINLNELLSMDFQEILRFLNDDFSSKMLMAKFNDLFEFDIQPLKIKQSIKKYQITDRMLEMIEEEYLYVLKQVGDKLSVDDS